MFPLWAYGPGGSPFRDSTELGYRIRGWYGKGFKMPPKDILPPRVDGWLATCMDIWNLPVGRFQLCVVPTAKVHPDFKVHCNGYVYTYYPAQSLADSVNGYEGCFWRAEADSDFAAMDKWVNKIMAINPTSVPGWSLKALRKWMERDTLATKQALDSALVYLKEGKDPAMPDSTKGPLSDCERLYLEWTLYTLELGRACFGP